LDAGDGVVHVGGGELPPGSVGLAGGGFAEGGAVEIGLAGDLSGGVDTIAVCHVRREVAGRA